MKEWIDKLFQLSSDLTKAIKAPKYFIIGLTILFLTLVLLPILKLLAIVLAGTLIFISFNPTHSVSRQVIHLLKKL